MKQISRVWSIMGNMAKRGKPSIGFQLTNLYDDYPTQLLPGVVDAVRERGYNLLIFPGETPNTPYGYLYQSNIVYDHIHSGNIKALVTATGTICNFLTEEQFSSFYSRFDDIPVVSIGVSVPGRPGVLVENASGMRKITEHLIKVHGYRKIAFIHGPQNNMEACERYRTFLSVMEENGIPFSKRLLVHGDFEAPSGALAARTLLKKKVEFEAILASNDNMAMGAIRELTALGIRIPRDVAVCGFDDFVESRYQVPPLTTIRQPLYQQARMAAEMAMDLLEGKGVPNQVILPTELVVRTSCGCLPQAVSLLDLPGRESLPDNREEEFSEREKSLILSGLEKSILSESVPLPETEHLVSRTRALLDFFPGKQIDRDKGLLFLSEFNDILNRDVAGEIPLEHWKLVLASLQDQIVGVLKNRQQSSEWILLLHKALILVSEGLQIEQASGRLRLERRIFLMREVIQRLISTLYLDELMDIIKNELPKFGIPCAYVVSYQKSLHHTRKMKWKKPPRQELLLSFDELGTVLETGRDPVIYDSEKILPAEYLPRDRPYTLVITPLFFMEDQLGMIIFEMKDIGKSIYEILSSQISSAFKSALLFQAREKTELRLRETLLELEDYNLKLKSLAQKDELTGLYNRRGFLTLAVQQMRLAQRMNKSGMVFYIDLDGLKKINDSYGHDEGDSAIRATAEILRQTFRNMDIISRLGGDEFTVFTVDTDEDFILVLKKRMELNIRDYNRLSGKPYQLSFSLGFAEYNPNTVNNVDSLMKAADNMLYNIKKEKKGKVNPERHGSV
jgi:diguanylate cyclase (GGDEF)-like protein